MLAALLLSAVGPQTVTFSHPCANAAVVVEALGKAAGVKMAVGGSVNQDYIALKFTDRSIDDIKRVMADTLNADWYLRNGVEVLDRTEIHLKKEQEQELAAFRDGIERYLEANPVKPFSAELVRQRMEDALKIKPDPGDERRLAPGLAAAMPTARFYPRLIRALGIDTLLKVTQEKPLKLVLRPDGSGSMSPHVRKIVEDFLKEGSEVWEIGIQTGGTVWIGEYGPPVAVPIGHTVTITKTDYSYDIVYARDEYRDPSNNSYSRPTSRVSVSRGADPAYSLPRVELKVPVDPLALSEDGLRMKRVFAVRRGFPAVKEPPTELDRRIVAGLARDLVTNDPLTLFGAAPIVAAIEQAGRDYVALVPDSFFHFGDGISQGKVDPVWWRNWSQGMIATEDSGTKLLKVVPALHHRARDRRLDRVAASRFVASYQDNGHVTLRAIADFVRSAPTEQATYTALDHISPLIDQSLDFYFGFDALRVYGALTEQQRLVADGEGFVTRWEDLPKDVRAQLLTKLCSASARFREAPPESPNRWTTFVESYSGKSAPGLLYGATSVPAGTTVRVRVLRATLLKPGPTASGAVTSELFSPTQFATNAKTGSGDNYPDFGRAAVSKAERLLVDVFVPGAGYVHFSAQVDDATDKTTYVPLGQLPEPFRSQLADAMKKNGGGTQ